MSVGNRCWFCESTLSPRIGLHVFLATVCICMRATVNVMDIRARIRLGLGCYMGIILSALLEILHRIHVLLASHKHEP